jgi:flagellar protein FlbT
MTPSLRLSLKAGERLYLNGAEVRVDRRVSIELLNDAHFLLSQHVLNPAEATTPLRALYVLLQTMLMSPATRADTHQLYRQAMIALAAVFDDTELLTGLVQVNRHYEQQRWYEALKTVRQLWTVEARVLGTAATNPET